MVKYDILESKNAYIDYTIKNYISCSNDLTEEELPRFTRLFDLMKNHQMSIGNCLVDHRSLQGIKLNADPKKKLIRNTNDLSEQLKIIGQQIDPNDSNGFLFFQSVTHLCDAIQYLNTEELIDLNDFFQGINSHKQSISDDTIKNGKSFFYPYNRYPKRK